MDMVSAIAAGALGQVTGTMITRGLDSILRASPPHGGNSAQISESPPLNSPNHILRQQAVSQNPSKQNLTPTYNRKGQINTLPVSASQIDIAV